MNLGIEVREAVVGWIEMITARPPGAARFNLSRAGFVNAVGCYAAVVLLTVLVESIRAGAPAMPQIAFTLAANALPPISLALVAWVTVAMLRLSVGTTALLVPGVYGLALVLLVGIPVSLAGSGAAVNALLGVLAYMLFRLAREIGKMSLGISIAFAALCIVVLVALPMGLYMLTVPAPPAA
jgi:hypothetical protein